MADAPASKRRCLMDPPAKALFKAATRVYKLQWQEKMANLNNEFLYDYMWYLIVCNTKRTKLTRYIKTKHVKIKGSDWA